MTASASPPAVSTRRASAAPARLRPGAVQAGLLLLLGLCLLLGTALGPTSIAPGEVVKVIAAHLTGLEIETEAAADAIVWDIRLPRVLVAATVGGTLAFSGAAYQGVFRNPLAEPYLLGVATGAGLVVTLALVLDAPLTAGGFSFLPLLAFCGAMTAVALAYAVARVGGRTPNSTLVLAGVALSSMAVSAMSYLLLVDQQNTIAILSWLLGSFNDSAWRDLVFLLPYAVPGAVLVFVHGRLLNVLQLDEAQARQLGVDVERTKLTVLAAASLATAAAVSVAGVIGFVGLIAPHVVRLLVGPDYRRLLPLATALGAAFLVLADLAARTLVSPSELPVGIVTSFAGAPFFLYLLRRERRVLL
jgi:iron complex transport system permease protein